MYDENIYFQTVFPPEHWLGIGWNENCQNCVLSTTSANYKDECRSECLDENSFVVIGRHDLTKYRGWGIIDVDASYNSTINNYTLYNRKNNPHSFYNQQLEINNVVFFKPEDFTQYTRGNIRAQFQRTYDPVAAADWSQMYPPSSSTCITYISSRGTNEHASVAAQYTQIPEVIEYWDVTCVNVTGLFVCFFDAFLVLHFVRLPFFYLFF